LLPKEALNDVLADGRALISLFHRFLAVEVGKDAKVAFP